MLTVLYQVKAHRISGQSMRNTGLRTSRNLQRKVIRENLYRLTYRLLRDFALIGLHANRLQGMWSGTCKDGEQVRRMLHRRLAISCKLRLRKHCFLFISSKCQIYDYQQYIHNNRMGNMLLSEVPRSVLFMRRYLPGSFSTTLGSGTVGSRSAVPGRCIGNMSPNRSILHRDCVRSFCASFLT